MIKRIDNQLNLFMIGFLCFFYGVFNNKQEWFLLGGLTMLAVSQQPDRQPLDAKPTVVIKQVCTKCQAERSSSINTGSRLNPK